MIYDFLKGKTADYLQEKLRGEFANEFDFRFQRYQRVTHEKIIHKGKSFLYKRGEHEYYMFAYKQRFSTIHYNTLPKYHITDCETIETYMGYRFANRMPVNIYCTDQRKGLGTKHLDLCKNCHRKVNFYSFGNDETDWLDVILKRADTKEYKKEDLRRDGYTLDWNQVSKAFRFKKGFTCERCGIDLSARRAEWFCEVHHIDHDKTNNSLNNLECLCVRCHSKVDDRHRSNYLEGKNKSKLNQFQINFAENDSEGIRINN